MSDDRDDDREVPPTPRHRPTGPLLGMGDAYAEQEQNRQANQRNQNTPLPEKSPLEKTIEREQQRVRELQENGRESLRREHQRQLEIAKREFQAENAKALDRLKSERAAIDARRNGGFLRGMFNRIGGRAAEEEERLRQLDVADQDMQKREDEHLALLREQQEQERVERDEAYQHESDEFRRTIEQVREKGHFPEHARLTREPHVREPARGH